jgi:hypothetical protein
VLRLRPGARQGVAHAAPVTADARKRHRERHCKSPCHDGTLETRQVEARQGRRAPRERSRSAKRATRQAEAERKRRAKIIAAEGEFQAAAKLTDAADIISRNPAALQLRYLQTLLEMGVNQNTTIVFPLPIEFIDAFSQVVKRSES